MALTNNQEVKGSRRAWEDGFNKYGERIFIAELAADVPAVGCDFTSANGETAETTLTELRCTEVKIDPEGLPGIFLAHLQFQCPKAYVP